MRSYCKDGKEIRVVYNLRYPQERESLELVHSGWEGSTIERRGHFAILHLPCGGATRLLR
jgi:hypothetical protein